jgi:hypothetical protein
VGPYQATIHRFFRIDNLFRGEAGHFGVGPGARFPIAGKIIVLSDVRAR